MVSASALDDSSQGDSTAMAIPASPTLQGIPPELKNKIYDYLASTRDVSGAKFVKIHKDVWSGDEPWELWEQFKLAVGVHPLTMTCRQLRTEFSPVIAFAAGQNSASS